MPKTAKLPWMMFFTADWSKDPALTLCTPATRGIWIDLICAMHLLDQSGELRGTADQLARFARCTTAEFVQAMTDLQTNRAAEVSERNGQYRVCNRRMLSAYKSRKSVADRVKRHREKGRNGECNADDTPHISEVRSQTRINPPPPSFSTDRMPSKWEAVVGDLLKFGVAKAAEAIRTARDAGNSVIQVRNVMEFWRGRQPAWGAGALYDRLMLLRPDQTFDSLWPPASPAAKQQAASAAQVEKHREKQRLADEERRQSDERREAENREHERREKLFGHKLDELGKSQLKKLVGQIWPDSAEFYLRRVPASLPVAGQFRFELLLEIEKRSEEAIRR